MTVSRKRLPDPPSHHFLEPQLCYQCEISQRQHLLDHREVNIQLLTRGQSKSNSEVNCTETPSPTEHNRPHSVQRPNHSAQPATASPGYILPCFTTSSCCLQHVPSAWCVVAALSFFGSFLQPHNIHRLQG